MFICLPVLSASFIYNRFKILQRPENMFINLLCGLLSYKLKFLQFFIMTAGLQKHNWLKINFFLSPLSPLNHLYPANGLKFPNQHFHYFIIYWIIISTSIYGDLFSVRHLSRQRASMMKYTKLNIVIQWKKTKSLILRPSFLKGGKKFGRAKHKDMNRDFKKLARMGLNNDQLYLRRPPGNAVIELQHKHCWVFYLRPNQVWALFSVSAEHVIPWWFSMACSFIVWDRRGWFEMERGNEGGV